MTKIKYTAEDIFRPTSFPWHTYIDRKVSEDDTYEFRLKKALRSSGRLVSITGTSKSGKTVLCHKVIDKDDIIDLSGAQIQSQADFWNQLAEKIRLPIEVQTTKLVSNKTNLTVNAQAKGTIPFIASGNLGGQVGQEHMTGENVAEKEMRSNSAIMEYMISNKKILLIDDFHYVEDSLQMYIARVLKTELFNGLKAIIIYLPHRSDDAVRHNPDLIGRTTFIEIAPWAEAELKGIPEKGFSLLGIKTEDEALSLLAKESITSPQLMQENCLNLADRLIYEKSKEASIDFIQKAFKDTVINYSHYKSILKHVLNGPAQGRDKRKKYQFKDGSEQDIYHLLLRAMTIDPPVLSMHVEQIKKRFAELLTENEKIPNSLTISNTVNHISKILSEVAPRLDTIGWREQELFILDPFLLFYLRWSAMER